MGIGASIALNDVVDPALTEASVIEVEERMGQMTSYRIRYDVDIADGDLPLLTSSKLDPGKVLSVLIPCGEGMHCIVKGPIVGQEVQVINGGAGSSIDVRGADTTSAMDRETRAAVWPDVTDSAAVTSLLTPYSYVTDIEDTKSAHPLDKHALVQRDTDLGFVRRLARRNGYSFWVTCDERGVETAHFRRPVLEGDPQAVLSVNVENPSVDALNLSWELDSPTSVVGVQLDLNTLKEIDGSVGQTPQSILGGAGQKSISGISHSGHFNAPVDDAGDLKARGEGALIDADWFLHASCEASLERLGTVARAYTVVEVRGLGSRYSGHYFVAAVRHTIDATSHSMHLELVRNGWGSNSGH